MVRNVARNRLLIPSGARLEYIPKTKSERSGESPVTTSFGRDDGGGGGGE